MMPTLSACTAAVDLTWPLLVGLGTALAAQQWARLWAQRGGLTWGPASSLAVLTQGAFGAWAGAAVCQTLADCTRSPALMALCALVGSVLVLDLCQLVRRRRRRATYLSDSIKST